MKFTSEETTKWVDQRFAHLGVTAAEFARNVGITEADLSRYKHQKQRPRVELLDRLADAFQVDIITILVVLGAIEPDAAHTPKIIAGQKNSKVVWQLNKK